MTSSNALDHMAQVLVGLSAFETPELVPKITFLKLGFHVHATATDSTDVEELLGGLSQDQNYEDCMKALLQLPGVEAILTDFEAIALAHVNLEGARYNARLIEHLAEDANLDDICISEWELPLKEAVITYQMQDPAFQEACKWESTT